MATKQQEAVGRQGPGPLQVMGDNEWQALLDKDDRSSPADHPEMVLITRAELGAAMSEAYLLARDQASRLLATKDERIAELEGACEPGKVYVTVTGLTGTGKSAVLGEIEIALKAIGVPVETDAAHQSEKNMTHADWQTALELYEPTVVLREVDISRATLEGAQDAD